MKLVVILACVLCISVAAGRKCYTCRSTVNEEDCSKNQQETDCGEDLDGCLTTGQNFTAGPVTTTLFTKICTVKQTCDAGETAFLSACKAAQGTTCEYKCCDTDLCNSGSTPIVSIILMVSCAVAGFLR